jgi:site-specific DNA recombinase
VTVDHKTQVQEVDGTPVKRVILSIIADYDQGRSETLRREQTRLGNNVARLITAYQEGLVSLAQLRQRMPELNKKSQAVESELQSLETAAVDQARYLQLAESLDGFRSKLRERAKTLDVSERQQILRLLVKEVLVAANSLTIRHSIPIPQTGPCFHWTALGGLSPFWSLSGTKLSFAFGE